MSEAEPSIIEHSVEKAHIWLKEIAVDLGVEDRRYAYRALRAVLHALRDPALTSPRPAAATLIRSVSETMPRTSSSCWSQLRAKPSTTTQRTQLSAIWAASSSSGACDGNVLITRHASLRRRHRSAGRMSHLASPSEDEREPDRR